MAGAPLYFSHPATLAHETGDHPERPERIPAIERELRRRGWLGYERRAAPALDPAALATVHAPELVERIRELSAGGGGRLDVDTVVSAGSLQSTVPVVTVQPCCPPAS